MTQNEGEGLTDDLWAVAEACRGLPVDVFYSSPACELLADEAEGQILRISKGRSYWHVAGLRRVRG